MNVLSLICAQVGLSARIWSPATQSATTSGLPAGSCPTVGALLLGADRKFAASTVTCPHQRPGAASVAAASTGLRFEGSRKDVAPEYASRAETSGPTGIANGSKIAAGGATPSGSDPAGSAHSRVSVTVAIREGSAGWVSKEGARKY